MWRDFWGKGFASEAATRLA
ncbi:hypothetical protein LJR221_002893 [Agrobacterium tumefaciens]|nr:hypothetical protein [Rhizobium rhizogenes]